MNYMYLNNTQSNFLHYIHTKNVDGVLGHINTVQPKCNETATRVTFEFQAHIYR